MSVGADHHKRIVDFVRRKQLTVHQDDRAHRLAPPGHHPLLTVAAALKLNIVIPPAERGLLIVTRPRLVGPGHVPAKAAV